MSNNDSIQQFAKSVLPGLSNASVARLQSLGQQQSISAKQIVKFDGPTERHLVFLLKGSTKLVAHVGPDREQIVAFAFSREMLALSSTSHTPYALHTLEECELAAFPAGELAQAIATDAGMTSAILKQVLAALDRSRERSVLLGRKSAQERLLSFLLDMIERIGEPRGETVILRLPMTRGDIADSLGLTIETVSRQLTELRDSGIIQTRGRSEIDLLDLDRMRDLASRTR